MGNVTVGEFVASGRTSEVFAYGHGSVVKVPRPGVPSEWSEHEARFTEAVRSRGVPAAEVRGLVDVDGRRSIVFERLDGVSMWQRMLERPTDSAALARELADIHLGILRAGPPPGVPDLVHRMAGKIRLVAQLSEDERTEAIEMVHQLPRGAALLHGDLHPGNVLMCSRGPVVIDWFDSAIGHPVADVVRSSLLLRVSDRDVALPHLPGATPELLSLILGNYLDGFRATLDHEVSRLSMWEATVAASRMAEHAQADDSDLEALWRSRSRTVASSGLTSALASPVSAPHDGSCNEGSGGFCGGCQVFSLILGGDG